MSRSAWLRRLARGASLVLAIAWGLALVGQAAGCRVALPSTPVSDVVRAGARPGLADSARHEPRPIVSGAAFDDDLGTSFFFGTKCATIRLRDWHTGTNAPLAPPAASIDRALGELP